MGNMKDNMTREERAEMNQRISASIQSNYSNKTVSGSIRINFHTQKLTDAKLEHLLFEIKYLIDDLAMEIMKEFDDVKEMPVHLDGSLELKNENESTDTQLTLF